MNLTSLTIKATAELLAKGEATSLAVTNAYLTRIDELNPKFNAYLTVFHETAREQAKQSDARRKNGRSLGVLDGITLAIKDNFSTKGQRTTAASGYLENYEPLYDATAVKKLKAAGAVILGKTNMDEFAMGSSTETSAFGPTANPWDMSRVPGGSSGGSAVAVAADLCAGALGSDTFGSVRQPAGFCGVVGLKPTYGLISRYGLLAMSSSLDVVGPITKSVEDAKILLDILKGQDAYDATTLPSPSSSLTGSRSAPDRGSVAIEPTDSRSDSRPPRTLSIGNDKLGIDLKSMTIGVPKEFFGEGMDSDVLEVINQSIEKLKALGATIVEVSVPSVAYAVPAYYVLCPVEVASNMGRYDGIRYGSSVERDGETHTLVDVYKQSRAKYLGAEVKRRIMLGTYASSAGYYDAYYNKAMKVRALIKQEMDQVLDTVDCLITPVSPSVAFKLGEKSDDPLAMYLEDVDTGPVNLAGVPAIAVPAGFVERDRKKLPVGVQLIGAPLGEDVLFTLASVLEESLNLDRKPTL